MRNLIAVALATLGSLSSTPSLMAQTTATQTKPATELATTALSLAPSDAAFFSTSLNMRKAWRQSLDSGWLAAVRQVAYVQQMESYLQQQWNNPDPQLAEAKRVLESPIVGDILNLLLDMSSHECFVIGDQSWSGFVQGFAELQYEIASVNSTDTEALRQMLLDLDKEDIDAIPVPSTIIGFQLKDAENARTQLDALEGVLQLALGNVEPLRPLAKGVKRKDLSNGQILSLTLKASDIPWRTIPDLGPEAEEAVEHVAELISDRQLVFSLGVIGTRLMMAISESPDTLSQLGKSENLLATEELDKLVQFKPDDLRSVMYTSGEFRIATWQSNFGHYFERIARQVSNAILAENENSRALERWQEKLLDDCEWLDDQIAEMIPEYHSALAFSFASAEGLETLSYDWTPNWLLENAKPLAVASHGGTSPLVLMATRQRLLEDLGGIIDATMTELPEHAKAVIDSGVLSEEDARNASLAMAEVWPLVDKIYQAFRDKVVPGMDGNEALVSIAALTAVSRLSDNAPPAPEPLPLPEIGLVMKLKNQDRFLTGCNEIIQTINQLIDLARNADPSSVPGDLRIPTPVEENLPGGGKRFSFPTGAPAPFDQFQVQLAINNQIAVVGYSTRQVRELFQPRPLAARPAWYSTETPTCAVGFVDISGICQAMKPWLHYGLSLSGRELNEPLAPGANGAPVPTGNDLLEIWDTFKKLGKTAGTTVLDEEGVTTSHWIWVTE